MANVDANHNDLEVDRERWPETWQSNNLEVVPAEDPYQGANLQLPRHGSSENLQVVPVEHPYQGANLQSCEQDSSANSGPSEEKRSIQSSRICGLRKRMFWICVSVLLIVVAGAAIGGGIGGTLHKSRNSSIQPDSRALYSNSSLAALNWTDSAGVTQYRVFSQDNSNTLLEFARSSRNMSWVTRQVTDASVKAKIGTPLAAAVSSNQLGYANNVGFGQ
jgi:hypothetical protein